MPLGQISVCLTWIEGLAFHMSQLMWIHAHQELQNQDVMSAVLMGTEALNRHFQNQRSSKGFWRDVNVVVLSIGIERMMKMKATQETVDHPAHFLLFFRNQACWERIKNGLCLIIICETQMMNEDELMLLVLQIIVILSTFSTFLHRLSDGF